MTGENYKLGSGARGLTSQSQQIMKAFILDQKGGGVREEDRRRGEPEKRGIDAGKKEVGLVLHNHTHSLHLKPLILYFYWTAEDGEYLTD